MGLLLGFLFVNISVDIEMTHSIDNVTSFVLHELFATCIQGKLEMIMGAPASCMDLELFSISDKFLQKMNENEALLGSYPVDDDCRIHVCPSSVGSFL